MIKTWLRKRIPEPLPVDLWQQAVNDSPILQGLSPVENQRLQQQVGLFLIEKKFFPKEQLKLDAYARLLIASQACLPVLNLGLETYRQWVSIIVYPQRFFAPAGYRDAAGVVHERSQAFSGQAWPRGPVVLSWQDILSAEAGFNVVVHECAHQLDMLDGSVNGCPPLHATMDQQWWTRIFSASYKHLQQRIEQRLPIPFDPYAVTDPGEFFAVMSEYFFSSPLLLQQIYPAVYRQLQLYYRQDPAKRISAAATSHRFTPVWSNT